MFLTPKREEKTEAQYDFAEREVKGCGQSGRIPEVKRRPPGKYHILEGGRSLPGSFINMMSDSFTP